MRYASIAVCLVALIGLGGCASAPISKSAAVELAKADALVADGCYDCLVEARDIYARVGVAKARPSVLPRLFETTVLLGLREKELALNPAGRFDAARALVPELPVTYAASTYLEIATGILPDAGGTPKVEIINTRVAPDKVAAWRAMLPTSAGSALFREYLSAGIDCTLGPANLGQPARVTGPPAATPPAMPPATAVAPTVPAEILATPLITYRRANCQRADRVMLAGIIDASPRFLEAGIIVGRVRSTTPTSKEIADARGWLTAGFAKWPQSPTITYALGSLNQSVGDCKTALTYYDKTLAIKPRHEDGHLGRLVCLSYLRQHPAAIDEATQMINDRNTEGEARYWRAWNLRETGRLADARLDSNRMKQIVYNDRALTLAGQIEHDQDDLDVAEKDLTDATRLNEQNCIAAWFWSLVQLKRQAWTRTAEGFVKAMRCYESAVLYDQSKLEEMKKADNVDEAFRAAQILGFELAIKDDSSQVSASAYNAAVNYARAQNREKALEYLDLAAKDPERAKQVAELRALIK